MLVLGTDTDAGKTTFALLWMSRFHAGWTYWKPVETGPSDSDAVAQLVPQARVVPPVVRLKLAAAPAVAAKAERRVLPSPGEITACRPTNAHLLVETFGGPFSPYDGQTLQVEMFGDEVAVLVGSSRVGAVGRVLAMCEALAARGITPRAIVLIGPADTWAEDSIRAETGVPVFGLRPPGDWSAAGVGAAATEQAATLEAIESLVSDTPLSPSWPADDAACVWHPYTPLRGDDEPLPVIGASAEWLTLADGRKIIDAISSWWTILFGHRDPRLMRSLAAASRQIDHVVFAGATHPWGAKLARQLLETTPWAGGRVFYSENGSTAVEVALKMAYQFWAQRGEPGRTAFVGFEHGYHGDTFGAMALSRDPVFFGTFEPLLMKAEIVPVDPNRLDETLSRGRFAAILIEPILQAAGGMRLHSEATLRDLCDVARRHDVLVIVDEVMTGMGRTGTFWAHTAAGVVPDLIASAKTLAGGLLPLAATLVSPRVVEAFDTDDRRRTFFHGHSFTAHPLACAVAVDAVELARRSTRPREIEAFWRSAFAEARGWPGVRDVRIRGTMAALELDVPGGYLADVGRRVRREALARGVLLRPLGNIVYALPPYETPVESLGRIVEAMKASTAAAIGG